MEKEENTGDWYAMLEMKMHYFNPLPHDKIVDWSNLKASADDKIYVT